MQLVFIDEAGFTPDWQNGRKQQPFYALSAVALPAEDLSAAYESIRNTVESLHVPEVPGVLGRGYEIKAKDISAGSGWWQHHNAARNAVRETMLGAPHRHNGSAILVVVDKQAHLNQYAYPENPYKLALQFMFERLAQHLAEVHDIAYCIYDHNSRTQTEVLEQTSTLIREGSAVTAYSSFYGQLVSFNVPMDRIVELSMGDSKYSLGLQVADFFATCGYSYHRDGRPKPCGWWQTLKTSLRKRNGSVVGAGLKRFP